MVRNSPKLTFAVLRIETSSGISETERDGEYPTVHRLSWDRLIALYGNEDVLKARIESMDAEFDSLTPWFEHCNIPLEETEDLRRLALDYASGQNR